jgi:signal transduction histidine kinase
MFQSLTFPPHPAGMRTQLQNQEARNDSVAEWFEVFFRDWRNRQSVGKGEVLQVQASTVLIISDEVDFSRRITARWQMERNVPTFTLLSGDLWPRFAVDVFDVAIVGELRRDLLSVVLEPLHSTGQPIFCVCQDAATAQLVRERWPRVAVLRSSEHWLETLVLASCEAVHRSRSESRARAAEAACATLDRQATLGRYMLEMRHNLNNALTSVLGNSDLLLLEPGSHSAQTRAQIETIRNMTLRIHEIMQRFSSLEKEMHVVAQQAEQDSGKSYAAVAAGT